MVGVMKMGNIAPRAGVLTITPTWLLNITHSTHLFIMQLLA